MQTEPSSSKIALKMSVDSGLLTKQLVNKVILLMKDRVFGHGTTTSILGSPEVFRIVKFKEEMVKEKVKAKVDSKMSDVVVLLRSTGGGQRSSDCAPNLFDFLICCRFPSSALHRWSANSVHCT